MLAFHENNLWRWGRKNGRTWYKSTAVNIYVELIELMLRTEVD